MNAQRLRFRVAMALFLLWVASLGILAVVSGGRPVERHAVMPIR